MGQMKVLAAGMVEHAAGMVVHALNPSCRGRGTVRREFGLCGHSLSQELGRCDRQDMYLCG